MSDFLKSAMGYFNPGTNNGSDNDFVGQIVEVGSVKLRVKRVIAEGKQCFFLSSSKKFIFVYPSAMMFSFEQITCFGSVDICIQMKE